MKSMFSKLLYTWFVYETFQAGILLWRRAEKVGKEEEFLGFSQKAFKSFNSIRRMSIYSEGQESITYVVLSCKLNVHFIDSRQIPKVVSNKTNKQESLSKFFVLSNESLLMLHVHTNRLSYYSKFSSVCGESKSWQGSLSVQ